MSIKAVKALVSRLHSDDEARSRFASDPDAVISEYRLTTDEKAAIKSTQMRVGPDGSLTLEQTALSWWLS